MPGYAGRSNGQHRRGAQAVFPSRGAGAPRCCPLGGPAQLSSCLGAKRTVRQQPRSLDHPPFEGGPRELPRAEGILLLRSGYGAPPSPDSTERCVFLPQRLRRLPS